MGNIIRRITNLKQPGSLVVVVEVAKIKENRVCIWLKKHFLKEFLFRLLLDK